MAILLSDNNSRVLTAPWSDPLGGGRGVIVKNYCHCISWEKATTIKIRLSKMLFFLCFRPTIKFQGGAPVDPPFEPPADPPWDATSQKLFLLSFRRLWVILSVAMPADSPCEILCLKLCLKLRLKLRVRDCERWPTFRLLNRASFFLERFGAFFKLLVSLF